MIKNNNYWDSLSPDLIKATMKVMGRTIEEADKKCKACKCETCKCVKEETDLEEASYSAKDAAAGKDIGKPGKNFDKIADKAAKKYGSKEAGEKVAGAVLSKLRHKKYNWEETEASDETIEEARDSNDPQDKEWVKIKGARKRLRIRRGVSKAKITHADESFEGASVESDEHGSGLLVSVDESTVDVLFGESIVTVNIDDLEIIEAAASIRRTKKNIENWHDREQGQQYGDMPYSFHPKKVMAIGKKVFGSAFTPETKKAALLHDVLEDTPKSPDELKRKGHSDNTIEAVKLLTKDKKLSYEGNIQKIIKSGNKHAMMVKYADNYANYTGDKSHWPEEKRKASQEKYMNSMKALGKVLGVDHHERINEDLDLLDILEGIDLLDSLNETDNSE